MANEIKPDQVPHQFIHALVMNLDKEWPVAIAAALSAWPGTHHYEPNAEPYYGKHLILPLTTQENGDEAQD